MDPQVHDAIAPGRHGGVPVRTWTPAVPRRLVVWLHGGGYVAGDLDMPESAHVAARLRTLADAVVVSVDYRLATAGVRFPVPLDDAVDAWRWATGAHPGLPAVLGGASAGGGLALATAHRALAGEAPRPDGLLLAYPTLHAVSPAPDAAAAAAWRTRPDRFTSDDVALMYRGYVGHDPSRDPGSPERFATPGELDPSALPPAFVVVSEFDGLRSSAEAFTRDASAAGVDVRVHLEPGSVHGHLNTPALPHAERTLAAAARWLARY